MALENPLLPLQLAILFVGIITIAHALWRFAKKKKMKNIFLHAYLLSIGLFFISLFTGAFVWCFFLISN